MAINPTDDSSCKYAIGSLSGENLTAQHVEVAGRDRALFAFSMKTLTFTFTPTQHWSARDLWDHVALF